MEGIDLITRRDANEKFIAGDITPTITVLQYQSKKRVKN